MEDDPAVQAVKGSVLIISTFFYVVAIPLPIGNIANQSTLIRQNYYIYLK